MGCRSKFSQSWTKNILMKRTIVTVDMEKVFSKVRVSFFPFTETGNEFYGRPIYNYNYTHICYPAHFQCLELRITHLLRCIP